MNFKNDEIPWLLEVINTRMQRVAFSNHLELTAVSRGRLGLTLTSEIWPETIILEDFAPEEEDAMHSYLLGWHEALIHLPTKGASHV